jgi:hypothetical protein
VHGPETAESLASFLRSKGVHVTVRRAGGEKRIIHFPDSGSLDDAKADRIRYQNLVSLFPNFTDLQPDQADGEG